MFFLLIGGFLWFIPVALVAAEMATVKGWENGGIYAWVGNTLGKRWGFAALFFQWFQITVGFVTMAFFILAAFSYIVHWDALYNNPLVMFIGVAVIVWVLTFVQLGGTKYTARIAKAGFFGGIVIPAIVLFVGIIAYLVTGHASQITMDWSTFVPDFSKVGTLVIFASFILAFAGVEASASHVNELKNPGRNYPLAMFILVIVAIVLDALGGLAVAITLPPKCSTATCPTASSRRSARSSWSPSASSGAGSSTPWPCCWPWACSPRSAPGSWARRAPCSTRPSRASCPRALPRPAQQRLGPNHGHDEPASSPSQDARCSQGSLWPSGARAPRCHT